MSLVSSCVQLAGMPVSFVGKTAKESGNAFGSILRRCANGVSSGETDAAGSASGSARLGRAGAAFPGGEVTLDSLREGITADMASVKSRVNAILAEAGIDATPAFTLAPDGKGGIAVSGDRADCAELEALLNADDELGQEFTRLVAQTELLQAAIEQVEFQEAYRADPFEAVSRYRHLLEGNGGETVSLAVEDDTLTLLSGLQAVCVA